MTLQPIKADIPALIVDANGNIKEAMAQDWRSFQDVFLLKILDQLLGPTATRSEYERLKVYTSSHVRDYIGVSFDKTIIGRIHVDLSNMSLSFEPIA